MSKRAAISLLLAPGQWKMINGIRISNESNKLKRVKLIIADEAEDIIKNRYKND